VALKVMMMWYTLADAGVSLSLQCRGNLLNLFARTAFKESSSFILHGKQLSSVSNLYVVIEAAVTSSFFLIKSVPYTSKYLIQLICSPGSF
jgi:hypothetical protein